eukprot:3956784-Heterocapsa_arctica.AAC.1
MVDAVVVETGMLVQTMNNDTTAAADYDGDDTQHANTNAFVNESNDDSMNYNPKNTSPGRKLLSLGVFRTRVWSRAQHIQK